MMKYLFIIVNAVATYLYCIGPRLDWLVVILSYVTAALRKAWIYFVCSESCDSDLVNKASV